jgi:membrane-bound lytic murein transglycosylase F
MTLAVQLSRPRNILIMLIMLLGLPVVVSAALYLLSINAPTHLDIIKSGGELRVVTRNSPSTYFIESGEPGGFEYELAQLFATFLGVELNMTHMDRLEGVYDALRLQNAHIAAAGLTQTPTREKRFDFAPTYLSSRIELIYRRGDNRPAPKQIKDLRGASLKVLTGSAHAELLSKLKRTNPELSWLESEEDEVLDLLQQVDSRSLDYTLIDSTEFQSNKVFFPRLKVAFPISKPTPIAWMLKNNSDGSLLLSLEKFFSTPHTRNEIERLKAKYYHRTERLSLVDNLTFQQHLEERLPLYETWFQEASEQTGVDWPLLAAIGYQESHWNPKAVSPTGVRGLMMLTRTTAREMGIEKRTDAKSSILGGAHYFAKIRERIPEQILEPDRTWFALAAYNVGFGHLEDARVLTERRNGNPDHWEDVAQQLPLLSQARWYRTLKHGFARGYEPVTYVHNIQRYLKQLEWEAQLQSIQQPAEPSIETATPLRLDSAPDTL